MTQINRENSCPVNSDDNTQTSLRDRFWSKLTELFSAEAGQGLTEYALILALIAILAIAALSFLGHGVTNALSTVGSSLANP